MALSQLPPAWRQQRHWDIFIHQLGPGAIGGIATLPEAAEKPPGASESSRGSIEIGIAVVAAIVAIALAQLESTPHATGFLPHAA